MQLNCGRVWDLGLFIGSVRVLHPFSLVCAAPKQGFELNDSSYEAGMTLFEPNFRQGMFGNQL